MYSFFNGRIIITKGDITEEKTEAIVNAANSTLMGGGGVDGAIHKKGGPQILEECKKLRKNQYPEGLPTGNAVITSAGNLKAKYVIHTVGPIFKLDPTPDESLIQCYYHSLKIARENNIKSISFPSISTGAYGFPKDRAARLVAKFLENYIKNYNTPEIIKLIFFH